MTDIAKHLYMTVFPNNSLIASQLTPEAFAKHYILGSAKHYKGKMIFAEIDINFRDPYFAIDDYLAQTVAHEDGSPKKTKFIASYAVLEHVPLNVIKSLYLATASGLALKLTPKPYTAINEPGLIRIFQEITPLQNLVATNLDQRSFGKYITTGTRSKGAPKIAFTQIELDVDEFLAENKDRNFFASPIPGHHPYRLYECLLELHGNPHKKTKTISLGSLLADIPYTRIRHGFWFDDGKECLFFPMPSLEEMKDNYFRWLKAA
ncbi:MAG: hypothetical protein GXO75_13240 [Calditrichaeota bacterium]|nr:hypothetical protein [Calditrichota bacterium]